MTLSDLSIDRPVLATVSNLLIVLVGAAAYQALPVREYPDVDNPMVSVSTVYVGANPATIESTLTEPIERALNGVEGVRTITSTSGLGVSQVNVEFVAGRDIDLAATDVSNAVQRVTGDLPSSIEPPIIRKAQAGGAALMWIGVSAKSMPIPDLTDLVERRMRIPLQRLPGVADVIVAGSRVYAMRLWLDPTRMIAHGVDIADVRRAVLDNNLQLPAGQLETHSHIITILADAQIDDPKEYETLVVKRSADGRIVRMQDVAKVELGASAYHNVSRYNGNQIVSIGVVRQSRANELDVADAVHAALPGIVSTLPEGVSADVIVDNTIFVRASMAEAWETLVMALVLVVLVNFLFLRSFAATTIASIAIPTSLVGTFALMEVLGFSVNGLTLLGLILAIGLLVDDAIVVLENIYRRQEGGEAPLQAAIHGAREVAFPVIATSVSLIAVLVPLAFLRGNTGRLFREFSLTVAGSIAISTFVALTLIPMLCAKFLRARPAHGRFARAFEHRVERTNHRYGGAVAWAVRHPAPVLAGLGATLLLSALIYASLPKVLAPVEDRGQFFTVLRAPTGSTLAATDVTMRQIQDLVSAVPEKRSFFSAINLAFGGPSSPANGIVVTRLVPWEERERSQQEIVQEMFGKFARLPGALAFPTNPQAFGLGNQQDVQLVVKSSTASIQEFQQVTSELLAKIRQVPGLTNVDADLRVDNPQLEIVFDRERAADVGVSPRAVSEALAGMLADTKTNEFILKNKQYDVIASVAPAFRTTPDQIEGLRVRGARGELIPLSNVVRTVETVAPAELRHYGLDRSVTLTASLSPGTSLGDVLERVQALAAETLPRSFATALAGPSREFAESSSELLLTFVFALVFIYLVLSAQFESFVHSLTVIVSVPLAVFGALFTLWLMGQSMNIYSQIGIILLVGLVAKNAILLVEYANQERARGRSLVDGIVQAGRIRLRPIVMTSLTAVFGAVPLMIASGAGAESRHPIGGAVVGGLIFSTMFTLIVIPVVYVLVVRGAEAAGISTIPKHGHVGVGGAAGAPADRVRDP
jgi:multidrug efflux pump